MAITFDVPAAPRSVTTCPSFREYANVDAPTVPVAEIVYAVVPPPVANTANELAAEGAYVPPHVSPRPLGSVPIFDIVRAVLSNEVTSRIAATPARPPAMMIVLASCADPIPSPPAVMFPIVVHAVPLKSSTDATGPEEI